MTRRRRRGKKGHTIEKERKTRRGKGIRVKSKIITIPFMIKKYEKFQHGVFERKREKKQAHLRERWKFDFSAVGGGHSRHADQIGLLWRRERMKNMRNVQCIINARKRSTVS